MLLGGGCGDSLLEPWDSDGQGEIAPACEESNEDDVRVVVCVTLVEEETFEFWVISVACDTFDA